MKTIFQKAKVSAVVMTGISVMNLSLVACSNDDECIAVEASLEWEKS